MRDGDFEHIQSALRAAVKEPAGAPADVVARTVRRCEAVLAGRAAEARLGSESSLPKDEVYHLAAAGLLGQLALGRVLPTGQDLSAMAEELAASDWLRSRLNGTPQDALLALHTGKLLSEKEPQASSAAAPTKAATLNL